MTTPSSQRTWIAGCDKTCNDTSERDMVKKKSAREREVHLLVGTRKGGFLFRSDQRRRRWQITGPFFAGWEVNHLIRDQRSHKLYAAIGNAVWGHDVQVGSSRGKVWRKGELGVAVRTGHRLVRRSGRVCWDSGRRDFLFAKRRRHVGAAARAIAGRILTPSLPGLKGAPTCAFTRRDLSPL